MLSYARRGMRARTSADDESREPESGVISVSRRTAVQDAVFPYTVMVDHRAVGRLWDWHTCRVVVPEGGHVVRLRGRRSSCSADVAVELRRGQSVRLRAWSRARRLPFTWRGAVTFLLDPFGLARRRCLIFGRDPFGLWRGSRQPWIELGQRPPVPRVVPRSACVGGPLPRRLSEQELELVAQIGAATFRQDHDGYNPADVDHLLKVLVEGLQRGDGTTPTLTADYELRPARGGYNRLEVDLFLRRLREEIEAFLANAAPPRQPLTELEAAIIQQVNGVTFSPERNGYHPRDVHRLLNDLVARAHRGELVAETINGQGLRSALRGSNQFEVDEFLRGLRRQIEQGPAEG